MCITLPTNPISRYLPKRNESMSQQRPMLITALFKIAPKWKQSKCVIGEWINKLWIYIKHNGTLLSNTKEWTTDACTITDDLKKYHAEKDPYIEQHRVYGSIYMKFKNRQK